MAEPTKLYAPESERAIVYILLNSGCADTQREIVESLEGTDFGDERNALVFRSVADLLEQGAVVDVDAVVTQLRRDGNLDLAGGFPHLSQTLDSFAIQHEYHTQAIRAYALRRKVRESLMKGLALTEDLKSDLDEVVSEVERMVLSAGERKGEAEHLLTLNSHLAAFIERVEAAETGLPWGLGDLDDLTRGLRKQRMYVVLARPSVGKSAHLIGVALNATMNLNKRVAFFSVENGEEEWMEVAYAWSGGFDMHSFRLILASDRPELARGYNEFAAATAKLQASGERLHLDTQSRTVAQMLRRARRMKQRGGLDLIVVDHIHEMDGPGENEERKVAKIARDLKSMAKELDIPVLSAGQLNRKCEDRPDKRPHHSDARASGGIEEAADTIGLLHRPEHYFGPQMKLPKDQGGGSVDVRGYAEWIIGKNRGGPRRFRDKDHVSLFFRAEHVKFESYSSKAYHG